MARPDVRIAFFNRRLGAGHRPIANAFYEKVLKEWPFKHEPLVKTCQEYDENIIRAQIDEVLALDTTIIIAVGTLYAQVVVKVLEEKERHDIKVIIVAVRDPVELGLMHSLERPGGNVTGVIRENPHPLFAAELFLKVKPAVRSVVIPCLESGDGGRHKRDAHLIADFYRERGISVTVLPTKRFGGIWKSLKKVMVGVDTVICLEGSVVEEDMHILAQECMKTGKTLFMNDYAGIEFGAAVMYGEDSRVFGPALYEQVLKVANTPCPAGDIPCIVIPNGRKLMVSNIVAAAQGLDLENAFFFGLDNLRVI